MTFPPGRLDGSFPNSAATRFLLLLDPNLNEGSVPSAEDKLSPY